VRLRKGNHTIRLIRTPPKRRLATIKICLAHGIKLSGNENLANHMLDFGVMTTVAILEAPKAAESIGRIRVVSTSWACRDKVSKVNIIRLVIAIYCAELVQSSPAHQ
jgi:hypothetical protein